MSNETSNPTMSDEKVDAMYRGLSIDLTNCLSQRNAELAEAKRVIAALIVAVVVPDTKKEYPVLGGREWLKNYNDRMYPKSEAKVD